MPHGKIESAYSLDVSASPIDFIEPMQVPAPSRGGRANKNRLGVGLWLLLTLLALVGLSAPWAFGEVALSGNVSAPRWAAGNLQLSLMPPIWMADQAAIERAQKHGFGVIGMNNSWMSGRGAIFVETIARAGLIGIHTVSSTRHVAPPGAAKAAYGTNPLSFGFPTAGEPFVIDMGTSAFMSTDLQFRERRGEQLPEGVAIDAQGEPTRDPTAMRHGGALLAFGGYKGFAMAMAAQALGVFGGSGTDQEKNYGYLIMAMKPDLLMPLADYRQQLSENLARIKATPRLPGVAEIRLPGERSFKEREQRLRDGIVIDTFIYHALLAAPAGQLPMLE